MKLSFSLLLISSSFLFSMNSLAGTEGMPNMPKIEPKKVYEIKSQPEGDSLLENRGFGDKEPEVRMMNLMMVEGSGFEGMEMDMSKPSATPSKHANMHTPVQTSSSDLKLQLNKSPTSPKTGVNFYEFTVLDAQGAPVKALKFTSKVYMTNMDMGTETPPVKEIKPGLYQVKVIFSMNGPWALQVSSPSLTHTFEVNVGK